MFDLKYILFWNYAAFVAPFHFTPNVCYVPNRENCRIWNCRYHYSCGKYSICMKF